ERGERRVHPVGARAQQDRGTDRQDQQRGQQRGYRLYIHATSLPAGARLAPGFRRARRCATERLDPRAPIAVMCRPMTPRVVAIGGGKGGVGKSLVAANVGIFLATLGKRVILVDAAFGAANLHIFAGVPRPMRSLSEALVAGGPRLADLAVSTHVSGVKLIGGVNDPPW